MKYNRLGKSDLQVSEIGLGCMSLPVDDFRQGAALVRLAFDFGINYFDTADLYGRGANEELLGRAISGFRKEIILATKVGNQWRDGVEGWTWNPSRSHILWAVEQSLKRLATDYIDLYQLHGGTDADNFEEITETFELLVKQGKIRAYGLSSIRPNVFMRYLDKSAIVLNMMQYSALDTRPEEYMDSFFHAGISVVARGSLAQGILLDKAATGPYLHHSLEDTRTIKRVVAELATEQGVSKQAIALKYVLSRPAVASTVVGVRRMDQLGALQRAYLELEIIRENDFLRLLKDLPKIRYQDHWV